MVEGQVTKRKKAFLTGGGTGRCRLDKQPQVSTILTKHKGDGCGSHNARLIIHGKNRYVNETRKFVSANQYILCS